VSGSAEAQLVSFIASFKHDPLGFVRAAFPWGEPGELQIHDGPDVWQTNFLKQIQTGLDNIDEVIRIAAASGNGVGKSSLVCWIILWRRQTFSSAKRWFSKGYRLRRRHRCKHWRASR
jgi:hypothetical protein